MPLSFFSLRLVSVHVVHPYSSIDTTAAWKKLRFILSVRSEFHTTDSIISRIDLSLSILKKYLKSYKRAKIICIR